MNLNELKIAIVGAGIGGLAAARALALRGADVRVLEQAPAIAEVGAGLQLSPNGMAVIGALGLGERLAATGAPRVAGITLKNTVGRAVLRLDLGTHGAGEHLCVHRADLIEVLADGARAAGVKIGLLHAVSEVRGGASPCVTTRQGAQVAADLVIGADGLHSIVRPVLNGPAAPFFTGQVAWRATVPDTGTDVARAEVTLHMGPGCHLVTYPLRGGKLRNIVAVQETRDWADESWSLTGDPVEMRAVFARLGPEAGALLARVEAVSKWGLFRHPVAARWHGDGLALLGDAAHPTLPFMAQGACLALEDAWVLADALEGADGIGAGLAAYQARRADRARRIVRSATRNAWKYHLKNPLIRGVAHLGLRAVGRVNPGAMVRQFDWIYREDVTGGSAPAGP